MKNKDCLADYDGTELVNFGSIISMATTEVPGGQVLEACVLCSNIATKVLVDIKLI